MFRIQDAMFCMLALMNQRWRSIAIKEDQNGTSPWIYDQYSQYAVSRGKGFQMLGICSSRVGATTTRGITTKSNSNGKNVMGAWWQFETDAIFCRLYAVVRRRYAIVRKRSVSTRQLFVHRRWCHVICRLVKRDRHTVKVVWEFEQFFCGGVRN